jgi:hypothetical protein
MTDLYCDGDKFSDSIQKWIFSDKLSTYYLANNVSILFKLRSGLPMRSSTWKFVIRINLLYPYHKCCSLHLFHFPGVQIIKYFIMVITKWVCAINAQLQIM